MLEIGSLLDGKYKILSEIGHGGMSVVYMALNEKANKTWAVKEIRKDGKMDFNVVKQGLVAEIETLKRLKHNNLPSIVDVIEDEDSFIIVMDYIEGNSLDKALTENGPQSQDDVIGWAVQLCDVLGYLHSCNPPIIYRDMKPANIMLKPDGSIALIDFGTAKTYEIDLGETTGIGTIGYAAPEQYLGSGLGRTDARTDIYCLGITLYHLLTGIDPCKNVISDRSIRNVDPSFSYGLDEIIIKCTQPNPNDRYQSCAELLYALEHHHEMGDVYRKQQKKKLGIFASSLIMAVLFASVSIFCAVGAEDARKDKYDSAVESVDSLDSFDEKCKVLKETVRISPERKEAYQKMIDIVIEGETSGEGISTINETEAQFLRWCLSAEGSACLDALREESPEVHKEICKDIAFYLWYNYKTENGGYVVAKEWFDRIAAEDKISDMYSQIAKSREEIQRKGNSKNPNKGKMYVEYWENLDALSEFAHGLEDEDYQIIAYDEIVSGIYNQAHSFVNETDEITKEDLLKLLSEVEDIVKKEFKDDKGVLDKIEEARERVNLVEVKE